MIRKQVYLEPRHDRMLKRRAQQRRVTEAEVIREALVCAELGAGSGGGRYANLDPAAGQRALAFMRSLADRRSKAPGGRGWTREELHQERTGRWAKS
jgi:hypothetical protein